MSLGEELRAIADLLARRDLGDEDLAVVAAHLGAARSALEALEDAGRLDHDRVGPLRGTDNVVAPPMVFGPPVARDGMTVVNAVVRCGARYEGPPGLVHGGIVAACFDELLAVAQRDAGVGGLTRSLDVRFRGPVRLGEALVLTAWVEHDDGRRALVRGAGHVDDDLRADAVAEFTRPR